MKDRMAVMAVMVVLVVVGVCGVGFSIPLTAKPPGTGDTLAPATGTVSATLLMGDAPAYTYVGSKKCKMCHMKQFKSWEGTEMGRAFDLLKAGEGSDAKTKSGLDVDKDYTTDAACLKCHTAGFGKEGGYTVPDPEDKKAVRKAKKLMNVGCESCHGPGSEYVKVFAEIQKSKRKYKVAELHAVGLTKIDETTCLACHNEESPTRDPDFPFDYVRMKADGKHEHLPLKQRE